jgi:hypothetical protein
LYLTWLADARLCELLARIDADLAETVRRAGCRLCGAVLHRAPFPRKPRGGPTELPDGYDRRHSFCCAVDGCRTRHTPPSVRFLGRKVYLGAVVVLATALRHGRRARARLTCANASASTPGPSPGGATGGATSLPRAGGGRPCGGASRRR